MFPSLFRHTLKFSKTLRNLSCFICCWVSCNFMIFHSLKVTKHIQDPCCHLAAETDNWSVPFLFSLSHFLVNPIKNKLDKNIIRSSLLNSAALNPNKEWESNIFTPSYFHCQICTLVNIALCKFNMWRRKYFIND